MNKLGSSVQVAALRDENESNGSDDSKTTSRMIVGVKVHVLRLATREGLSNQKFMMTLVTLTICVPRPSKVISGMQ